MDSLQSLLGDMLPILAHDQLQGVLGGEGQEQEVEQEQPSKKVRVGAEDKRKKTMIPDAPPGLLVAPCSLAARSGCA